MAFQPRFPFLLIGPAGDPFEDHNVPEEKPDLVERPRENLAMDTNEYGNGVVRSTVQRQTAEAVRPNV